MEATHRAFKDHPWLIPMLKYKLFHEECDKHSKKQRCFFCIDCMCPPFCERCLKKTREHEGHTRIQTYRSSNQSGVRVHTISKFLDLSDIHYYVINGYKIVYINQRKEKGHSCRANATHTCDVCGWQLDPLSSAKFCSIECKVRRKLGSKLDELMNPVTKPVRRHRRKGIPVRAPLS